MVNDIQLRRQYLIGFLDGLCKSDDYDTYDLEQKYRARLDELDRLIENEDTID